MLKLIVFLALAINSIPQLQRRTEPPQFQPESCETHMSRASHAFRVGAAKAAEVGADPALVKSFLRVSILLENKVKYHDTSDCNRKILARLDIVQADMIYALSLYGVDPSSFK